MEGERAPGTQSLRRALAILRTLAAGPGGGGVSLQDAAAATGLSRPTVHRLLKTLVEEGIVEQHARTRRYVVGEQISMLALARPQRSPLLRIAEPLMAKAAREIGDTVFLTVRTGDDTLCTARCMGSYPIQVLVIDVGARRPLGVASAGLALLSHLAVDEATAIIERNALRFGSYRMDQSQVMLATEESRCRGYARRDPGLVPGTKAISVVVPSGPRHPLAALTVAAVRPRLRPAREGEVVEMLEALATGIHQALRS